MRKPDWKTVEHILNSYGVSEIDQSIVFLAFHNQASHDAEFELWRSKTNHKIKSRKGTVTKRGKKETRKAKFEAKYRERRKGRVSHSAAAERAAKDTGISLRTAWKYSEELKLK